MFWIFDIHSDWVKKLIILAEKNRIQHHNVRHLFETQKRRNSTWFYNQQHFNDVGDYSFPLLNSQFNLISEEIKSIRLWISDAEKSNHPDPNDFGSEKNEKMYKGFWRQSNFSNTLSSLIAEIELGLVQKLEGQYQPPTSASSFSVSLVPSLHKMYQASGSLANFYMKILDVRYRHIFQPFLVFGSARDYEIYPDQRVLRLAQETKYSARHHSTLNHEIQHLKFNDVLSIVRSGLYLWIDIHEQLDTEEERERLSPLVGLRVAIEKRSEAQGLLKKSFSDANLPSHETFITLLKDNREKDLVRLEQIVSSGIQMLHWNHLNRDEKVFKNKAKHLLSEIVVATTDWFIILPHDERDLLLRQFYEHNRRPVKDYMIEDKTDFFLYLLERLTEKRLQRQITYLYKIIFYKELTEEIMILNDGTPFLLHRLRTLIGCVFRYMKIRLDEESDKDPLEIRDMISTLVDNIRLAILGIDDIPGILKKAATGLDTKESFKHLELVMAVMENSLKKGHGLEQLIDEFVKSIMHILTTLEDHEPELKDRFTCSLSWFLGECASKMVKDPGSLERIVHNIHSREFWNEILEIFEDFCIIDRLLVRLPTMSDKGIQSAIEPNLERLHQLKVHEVRLLSGILEGSKDRFLDLYGRCQDAIPHLIELIAESLLIINTPINSSRRDREDQPRFWSDTFLYLLLRAERTDYFYPLYRKFKRYSNEICELLAEVMALAIGQKMEVYNYFSRRGKDMQLRDVGQFFEDIPQKDLNRPLSRILFGLVSLFETTSEGTKSFLECVTQHIDRNILKEVNLTSGTLDPKGLFLAFRKHFETGWLPYCLEFSPVPLYLPPKGKRPDEIVDLAGDIYDYWEEGQEETSDISEAKAIPQIIECLVNPYAPDQILSAFWERHMSKIDRAFSRNQSYRGVVSSYSTSTLLTMNIIISLYRTYIMYLHESVSGLPDGEVAP